MAFVMVAAGIGLLAANTSTGRATEPSTSPQPPIRIGAVFPRNGDAGALATEELRGIQIAVDLANSDGGIDGAPVSLDVQGIDAAADAPAVLDAMKANGVEIVMGAYSSELSIPVSAETSARGMVYWETGAVADQLTGRGLPNVFRVGASSTTLGTDWEPSPSRRSRRCSAGSHPAACGNRQRQR